MGVDWDFLQTNIFSLAILMLFILFVFQLWYFYFRINEKTPDGEQLVKAYVKVTDIRNRKRNG